MRVLAVGAHPDDLEILCAGTLAKYARRGDAVVMCYATNGNQGHFVIQPPELARIRCEEARRSTQVIGAEFLWLDLPDQLVEEDLPTRLKFIEMVRQARPDLVLTHHPDDYIMDHRRVSRLVFEATFVATVAHVQTGSPHHTKTPPIYYMDSLAGVEFLPEEFVDISDTIELKREMLSQHQSQVQWLKEHDNIDILEFVDTVARFRGLQCGVRHAEGFRGLRAWGRISPERLLP